MKTTSTQIQLQHRTVNLNKKGRRENCVQTQVGLNLTKLKAQLLLIRPDHLTAKPPLVSQHKCRHRLLDIHLTNKDQNTNPIDIQPHNNNILHTKKCG